MTESLINLYDLDQKGLQDFFVGMGEKPFRAKQILQWIHTNQVDDFDVMTNISKALREKLRACAHLQLPVIESEQRSSDGTIKWLIRLAGGNAVETVFIPEDDRGTLCVSSQVGCPLDCSFCSTAQQGFNRNLAVSEIIGQVQLAAQRLQHDPKKNRRLTNVVMMGMGEPMLNFENVVAAMNLMLDDHAYGLSRRRVTLSTSGVVPKIDMLREVNPVSLAISLHASNNELRDVLVPINRSYPIAELLAACKRYAEVQPHGHITFEYVMLSGINDSVEQAHELAKLLSDIPAKINLIPFNPFPGSDYKRSSNNAINRFRDVLMQAGLVTVTRRPRGDDIDAACGQLVGKVEAKGLHHRKRRESQAIEVNA